MESRLKPHVPKKLYRALVKPFSQKVGLHSHFVTVYRLANGDTGRTVNPVDRPIPDTEYHEVTLGGIDATFLTRNQEESKSFRYHQTEEFPIVEDVVAEVGNEDIFWDIGSWYGLYSVFAGRAGADVHAFEPLAYRAERTARVMLLNDVCGHVHEFALGSTDGSLSLNFNTGQPDPGNTIEIPKTHPDAEVEAGNLPQPTVLKIDVDGSELEVLEGMEHILRHEDCRLVYVEAHGDRLDDPQTVAEKLESAGFSVKKRGERNAEILYKGVNE